MTTERSGLLVTQPPEAPHAEHQASALRTNLVFGPVCLALLVVLALPAVREAWFEQHNHVHPVADLLGTSDAAFPDGDVLIEAIRRAWFADGGGEPAPRMQVIGTPAVVHVFCTQPENEQLAATIAQFR